MLETTCFLFEIPTGLVADLHSRRLSIIIGLFLIGAGFLIQGLVPTFLAMLIAQVVWGIGYTFTSGAGFILLGCVLLATMVERNFSPVPREERETFRHLRRSTGCGPSAFSRTSTCRRCWEVRSR